MKPDPPVLRRWTVSRDQDHAEWNEDASRAEAAGGSFGWRAFIVVADGVATMPFGGAWARALVEAADPTWTSPAGLESGVQSARERFDPLEAFRATSDFVLERLWSERGAAATLLVADVTSAGRHAVCHLAIVGDCLFLMSDGDQLVSFPRSKASELTNRTNAVRTKMTQLSVESHTYSVRSGTILAMASDAMGAWLLRQGEGDGPGRVHTWLSTATESDLPNLDDDLTLVLLEVPRSSWIRALVGRLRNFARQDS